MHIHILGICGTFMGSLAILAKQLGHDVSGSDANVYPPMSTQLEAQGISLCEGYKAEHLQGDRTPDLVVIGNAMSRGNPAVEYVLDRNLPYISGPQWLQQYVLQDKWVLAVAGTHGKTTTSSMVAWVLEYAGMEPGYLIGGVPKNFEVSARLGGTPFFVVEADEYDSAFFDKRSKFVHYRPRTCILNNLEYDHADIFPDVEAIRVQFHHLVRTVPGNGLLIAPVADDNITQVLRKGCWTPVQSLAHDDRDGTEWYSERLVADGSAFRVWQRRDGVPHPVGEVRWGLKGQHNVNNGLAALIAAHHVGVTTSMACEALSAFAGVKRRLENLGQAAGVTLYDDFAHHPTAIATTLQGLHASLDGGRLLVVLEPRSNTMRLGVHKHELAASVALADAVFWYQPDTLSWDLASVLMDPKNQVYTDVDAIVAAVAAEARPGDHLVIMSNGGFAGIHHRLKTALETRQ